MSGSYKTTLNQSSNHNEPEVWNHAAKRTDCNKNKLSYDVLAKVLAIVLKSVTT